MNKRLLVGLALVPLTALGIVLAAAMFGTVIDAIADRQLEHERCLRQATNGWETERCR